MTELLHKIALTKIPRVGPKLTRHLVSYCGSIEAVFKQKKSALVKIPLIGEITAKYIAENKALEEAEIELALIQKNNINYCFYLDKDYPKRLVQYDDAPILFYYKGSIDQLHTNRTVGIVGTRTPTDYGLAICDRIVTGLQPYGVSIVSGLAYGIDAQAHRKSVELDIPTFGILGNGLNGIYPAANRKLAERMLNNGAVISEFNYFAKPDREHFPARNRIIAGLCDVVIVIESKWKGGSIITAEIANAYNKDVFAVPGKLTDEFSEGCNNLIKSHKASLIQSAKDISYIMRWDELDDTKTVQSSLFVELSEDEKMITDLISKFPKISIDQLSAKTKFTPSIIASNILNLEFKGVVRCIPGKRYTLT